MRLGMFLIFLLVPLVELALLIKLGTVMGFWPTFAIVILTAIIGSSVLRQQGFRTMVRLNEAMARGEPPVKPVIDGAFILLAGAFLLTPGLITDTIGLLLLIPAVRDRVAAWSLSHLLSGGSFRTSGFRWSTGGTKDRTQAQRSQERRGRPGPTPHQAHAEPGDGPIIEGEYERLDDTDPKKSDDKKR